MSNSRGAAGIMIFVHSSEKARMSGILREMNSGGRVSPEVLSLYCVQPTRQATRALAEEMRGYPELQHLEAIDRLKPNNGLRDLTAPWRMDAAFVDLYSLVVSLETVNPEFRKKYPIPNLTLQAGSIEANESPQQAARRELLEEARIVVRDVVEPPVGLLGGGMLMYTVFVTSTTQMRIVENVLYID